uniref:Uncharacterized protein n=1 Tax=Poecilia mexicana TaxID=48701 RepID=A0A3B3YDK4_9TELE
MSNPTFSYYKADKNIQFYRWTSPPGAMKILCIIIVIMCVAIFACVASTLAWDYDMSVMGGGTAVHKLCEIVFILKMYEYVLCTGKRKKKCV